GGAVNLADALVALVVDVDGTVRSLDGMRRLVEKNVRGRDLLAVTGTSRTATDEHAHLAGVRIPFAQLVVVPAHDHEVAVAALEHLRRMIELAQRPVEIGRYQIGLDLARFGAVAVVPVADYRVEEPVVAVLADAVIIPIGNVDADVLREFDVHRPVEIGVLP